MTDAKLLIDDVLRPAVQLERHLPDPPPIVWQALTERERLRSWFPCDVAVSGGRWEPGAAITFTFPPDSLLQAGIFTLVLTILASVGPA